MGQLELSSVEHTLLVAQGKERRSLSCTFSCTELEVVSHPVFIGTVREMVSPPIVRGPDGDRHTYDTLTGRQTHVRHTHR